MTETKKTWKQIIRDVLFPLTEPEVRKDLARILHRIEYDVQRQENIVRLQRLCQQEGIFPDYLQDFIEETCYHAKDVGKLLANEKS